MWRCERPHVQTFILPTIKARSLRPFRYPCTDQCSPKPAGSDVGPFPKDFVPFDEDEKRRSARPVGVMPTTPYPMDPVIPKDS